MNQRYPMDTLPDAQESRARVWEEARGANLTSEHWKVLAALRAKWGDALYDRSGRTAEQMR